MHYEYKFIPAPQKIEKHKGAKTPAERFARTIEAAINALTPEGWEYMRSETLPAEERRGLTGRSTVFHTMLVFRRPAPYESLRMNSADPVMSAPKSETSDAAPTMRALRPAATDTRRRASAPPLTSAAARTASGVPVPMPVPDATLSDNAPLFEEEEPKPVPQDEIEPAASHGTSEDDDKKPAS